MSIEFEATGQHSAPFRPGLYVRYDGVLLEASCHEDPFTVVRPYGDNDISKIRVYSRKYWNEVGTISDDGWEARYCNRFTYVPKDQEPMAIIANQEQLIDYAITPQYAFHSQGDASPKNPQTIKQWQQAAYANSKAKGFHDADDASIWTRLGNIHCEVSEAWEALRAGMNAVDVKYCTKGATSQKEAKPEGFSIELADILLRVFDLAEAEGIDLQKALAMKHAYNKTRPPMHGGKVN
jgi:NTP pyrophosphatase (non-canonical NTP hydrolase)